MPQVTLYLDAETDEKVRRAARAARISRSRWVAEAIRKSLAAEWPATVRELAGAWENFPSAEEIREGAGKDTDREPL